MIIFTESFISYFYQDPSACSCGMAQSGIKAGSESDGQELDCDEITLKGEDIFN